MSCYGTSRQSIPTAFICVHCPQAHRIEFTYELIERLATPTA
jgi:hypothetical protein